LLQAYSLSGIAKELPLVISGAQDQRTVSDIRRLELIHHVMFLPLESTEQLAEAYRGATAFLFPSLYEGFGLPPLEAMASGVRVLTSTVCSLPEVVGEAAILADPVEVESIAEGIRRIATDSGLRAQLRAKGLARSQQFSWEETAHRVAHILE